MCRIYLLHLSANLKAVDDWHVDIEDQEAYWLDYVRYNLSDLVL